MPQDAYYYFYGQHLALSYYDHPPMIGYLLRGATELFGQSVLVIKLADCAITLLTVWCFHRLAALHLRPLSATFTTIAFTSTLLVSLLCMNSTPDVPLLFFWTLSVWLLHRAIFEERYAWWPLAGVAMGLAFSSKYTALLLPIGAVAFLLTSPAYRKKLVSGSFASLFIGWLLGAAPVILWNYQHDWSSYAFQSTDRASRILEFDVDLLRFLASQGLQMLLLLPPLFALLYLAHFRIARLAYRTRKLPDVKTRFLLAFSVPLLLLFLGVGPVYWIKLNWMMPAYITGAVLAGRLLNRKWLGYQLASAAVFHFVLLLQVVFYLVPIKSDDTWVGWSELADEVRALRTEFPEHIVFSNDDYKTSAVLDFYLTDPVYAGNVISDNGKQFNIIYPDLTFLRGRDALYFDSDKRMQDTLAHRDGIPVLKDHFATVKQLSPLLIRDESGRLLRKFHVFECRDYKGPVTANQDR